MLIIVKQKRNNNLNRGTSTRYTFPYRSLSLPLHFRNKLIWSECIFFRKKGPGFVTTGRSKKKTNRKFNYNLCQVWKVVFHWGWTALADDHIREILFFFFLQTFLSSTLETSRGWLSAYLWFGYFSLLLVSCTILFSLRFCCYLKEKFFLSLLCPPSLLYCWMLSKEIKVSLKSSKKCIIFWKQKLMGAMKEQRVHSLQLSKKKIWVCS